MYCLLIRILKIFLCSIDNELNIRKAVTIDSSEHEILNEALRI